MIISYTTTEKDEGRTAYSIMRNELLISSTLLRRLKQADAISVSGQSVFTNYKLLQGQTLAVNVGRAEPDCGNVPEDGEIEILYESDGLIAVNKPSGVLVHPSRARYSGTLSNFVAGYLLYTYGAGCCHAVNRLDRDTSGVVLFAKNSYFKSIASEALSAPDVRKEYLGIVYGQMPTSGTIDVPILRKEERNLLRIPSPDGQRAVTHFQTLYTEALGDDFYSLVRFRLETGRTHQIRVHCLYAGHPILGDKMYCTDDSNALSQALGAASQALHARLLFFADPLSKELVNIIAPWRPPWRPENYACNLRLDMLASRL